MKNKPLDFQVATAEHVLDAYKKGQRRCKRCMGRPQRDRVSGWKPGWKGSTFNFTSESPRQKIRIYDVLIV